MNSPATNVARAIVVLPTYNERENIAAIVPAILGAASRGCPQRACSVRD